MKESIAQKNERLQLDRKEAQQKLLEAFGVTAMTTEQRVALTRYSNVSRELAETWLLMRIVGNEGLSTD